MPRSSGRTKRPAVLSGIPQRVIDLSPRDWQPARRAAWCRAYLAGARDPNGRCPDKLRDLVLAFRRGQATASDMKTEIAQVADVQRVTSTRREAHLRQMHRERSYFTDSFDPLGLDILPTASALWFPRAMGGRAALQPQVVDVTSPTEIPAGSIRILDQDMLP